jgi:putative transposase
MPRRQAFKFEWRPNGQQERLMRRFARSTRFVFNKAFAVQKGRYAQGGRHEVALRKGQQSLGR